LVQNFSWNYADGAVAVTSAAGLVCLALWLLGEDVVILGFAALFLASASLIKEEGLMFAATALVAAAAATPAARRPFRPLLGVAGAVIAGFASWEIFIRANGLGAASTYAWGSVLRPSYVGAHAGRVGVASRALVSDLVHVWSLPAAAGALALLCAFIARRYVL